MKRSLFLFLLPFFIFVKCYAQPIPDTVEVAVRFGSICCGPDSDLFLKDFYKQFNKGKCKKVAAFKAGGCGKEGEFFIFFSLKKLKEKRRKIFTDQLEELVNRENLKNKSANSSAGGIAVQHDQSIADRSYCRIPVEKWK